MKNETMGVTELALAPESKKNESAVASADLANTAITMSTFTEEKKPPMVKRLAEIPALRGKDRKVYRMSDGTEQAVFSPVFNTTLDDEERHANDAQPTIVEDEDGKHYTCAGKHFCAKFSRGDNDELFSIEEGVYKVTVLAEAGDRYRHAKPHLHKRAKHETKIDTLIFDEVIPDTDYEYSVKKRGVKENIVIRKPASAYRYPFLLNCENVAARMDKSAKRIAFLSTETGEEIFHIPAPFMVDAMGVISTAVDYEMREMRDGALLLTVVADTEWMNAEERAFPVTIDPQIDVSGIYDMEMYSWVDGVMSEASSHTIGITENDDGELSVNRMYMSFTMPRLPRNPRIKKAELLLNQIEATVEKAPAPLFGLYHVTGELCPGDCTPSAVADLIDYAKMYQCEDGTACYTFDVTTLVDMLKWGESASPQFVLKLVDETIDPHNCITIGGGSDSRYSPWLVITYESSYGVNTSYRTHTHDLGRFGQGSVDLQRGNLMFESVDFTWSGNKMPVTIKHLFNSALSGYMYANNSSINLNTAYFASMQIGYGFKLNIMQSMMHLDEPPIEWTAEELEEENREYDGYVYIGENGEETYFKESSRCTRLDSNGQCYKLYEDVGGSDMLYDPVKRSLTQGDETYNFDIFGRLVEIADANNNSMKITYMDNRITSVTDGAGRVFRFTYDANTKLLLYISAPDGTRVSYGYTNNLLSHITYPTGEKASIAYAWNRPQSVTLQDKDYKVVYKVAYTYDSARLASVTEYGSDGTVGAKTSYSYSVASGRTIATTTELKDSAESEAANNVIATTYTFDDDGNLVSEYVYSTDTGNVGSDSEESGINPHSGDGGAGVVSNINNLLTGHDFESLAAWLEMPSNSGELTISNYAYEPYTKFGKKVLRMQSYNVDCGENGVYQVTNSLPKGQYTFSAYLRVLSAFSGTDAGAFIRVTDISGKVLGVSEHLTKYESEYTRLIVPFELDAAQSVQVQIVVNGKGTIYADAAQLENNPYANAYNMLENGNFERGIEGWTPSTDVSYSTGTRFNMSRSLYMKGSLEEERYAYQTPVVRTTRSTRESFTLSGWAKGWGLPNHDRMGVHAPQFRLRAVVKYYDTTYREYGSEEFTADFSPCTEEWQFASVQFSKSKYRTVQYIRVYCDYGYNSGTVYFDDIQLVRNSLETNLAASDFVVESSGIADDTIAENSDTAPTFTEAKDAHGNALTETTFTDGEFGTIYRSFAFNDADPCCPGDEAGNDLVEETDARGYKTTYTVDGVTSRNEEVTDRLGNKTSYEYDDSGRTTKVTSKKADGTELANVSYAYDAFDNMTEIVRGDGMKYALAYNEFHNLESIGINGKTEKLIKYTYKNGNGRLKQMTYANGHTMKATYNAIGQMVAERWFETEAQAADPTATPIAHYKYVYDGDGNIVRSIDIFAKKEYNYEYEEGKIVRATEADIELSGEIVASKVIVNTVKYYYDTEGKMTKKVITPASNDPQTIYYETNNDDTTVKFYAGGRYVTSQSGTDSFGRKAFDELQLGTDFVSRQFVYHAGKITAEHKEKARVKSSATTQLVSQIILSNGTTLSYGYDAEERITSVVETYTVDETPVTNTTIYTYDTFGQLLTETVNGEVVNSMKYDNYGNIIEKNGIVYIYGDNAMRDLLTSYNGQPIAYDALGNPTVYLGNYLTWEKGNQLKSFGSNTYTYNANGIRTQKIVNGSVHNYVLDGFMLLEETWEQNSIVPLYDSEASVCGIKYNETPFYFMKNLQDDVIAIIDEFSNIVVKYSYDAWGVCSILTDKTNIKIGTINPYRYRSYYFDNETGLYYLQHRYYDPVTVRFLNLDSTPYLNYSGTIVGNNLICYCENNPINTTDYFGHSWFKDKIIEKVDACAPKAVAAIKEAVIQVGGFVKDNDTTAIIVNTIKNVVETAAGAIAKTTTTTLIRGISGITSTVVSNIETKTRIINAANNLASTINNEFARDFWNIYVIELGGTVLKELKPIVTFSWNSAKSAFTKCLENKSISNLAGDWSSYKSGVMEILLKMTGSVEKVLDIYKKMKVEPLSLSKSNLNLKNNNIHVLKQAWYISGKMPSNPCDASCTTCPIIASKDSKYIKDQDRSVSNLQVGDEYMSIERHGCGIIASYNVGVKYERNVDLPAIIYWYEQNSGLVIGGEFGVNPYKIPEFLDTINLKCTMYDSMQELEKLKSINDGVYIVCQWNNKSDISSGAHFYMVENTGSGLKAYNNGIRNNGTTFADLIGPGSLILAYRIHD